MPTITDFYGIAGPVPFADVQIDADNRLYLDPRAIRLDRTPREHATRARECLDSFASELLDAVLTESVTDSSRGEQLLHHFSEPWETRLGMSTAGFHGHGGAEIVGDRIRDALTHDLEALIRVGLLKQIEDLPLFVNGMDRDITSDITTRIVYDALAAFTAEMLGLYPEFTSGAHRAFAFEKQIWSPEKRDWTNACLQLPAPNGKELLLVPTSWARRTLLMSAGRFYETSVLSFAQSTRASIGLRGNLTLVPKHQLKKQPGLARGRSTNTAVTLEALEDSYDLIEAFKRFVSERLRQDRPAA